MTTYADTYAQRVEEAITMQGLRPIMVGLTQARIPFTVEQTGGMFMVGFTECPDGSYIAWNAEGLSQYASAWAYANDHEAVDEEYPDVVSTAIIARVHAIRMATDIPSDVWHLWHDMDADTYMKDYRMRAEIAHRIGHAYSLYESISDNYSSIPDNIPSAQDYADTIATQYADMFPEDRA